MKMTTAQDIRYGRPCLTPLAAKSSKRKMTIELALVTGFGFISDENLLQLPRSKVQDIRSRMNSSPLTCKGYCAACSERVFLRYGIEKKISPHFVHFSGVGDGCIYKDSTKKENEIRAEIFEGRQESPAHKAMCKEVAQLCMLDKRYIEGTATLNVFYKSEHQGRGLYPDVKAEFEGLGEFVFEIQLAPMTPLEIQKRTDFYIKSGVHLIWVLPTSDRSAFQRAYISDIASLAKGNVFYFDRDARDATVFLKRLHICAIWQNSDQSISKKVIPIDDLNFPPGHLPYYVNAFGKEIFDLAEERRDYVLSNYIVQDECYELMPFEIFPGWDIRDSYKNDRFIKAAFSILSYAEGHMKNYLNSQPNLKSALDSYLNSWDGKEHAAFIKKMLECTQAKHYVSDSVWKKLDHPDAKSEINLLDPFVSHVYGMFPEVFRDEHRHLSKNDSILPAWAMP